MGEKWRERFWAIFFGEALLEAGFQDRVSLRGTVWNKFAYVGERILMGDASWAKTVASDPGNQMICWAHSWDDSAR